jgi:LysR family nitrogen assimilation transcriptional regulator
VESALAEAGVKPRVALEVESVPAILDLVVRHPLHAVLALNAIVGSAREEALAARPILLARQRRLSTSLWMATSAQRPRGPLLEQALPVIRELVQGHLGAPAMRVRKGRMAAPPETAGPAVPLASAGGPRRRGTKRPGNAQ